MAEPNSDLDHYGSYCGVAGDPRNPPTPEDRGWIHYTCENCGDTAWLQDSCIDGHECQDCDDGSVIHATNPQPQEMLDE